MADDRVTWAFENAGMVVPLSPTMPKGYFKAAGASGLGVAPTTVQIDSSVSGGGVFRRSRREPRDVVMPVVTFGDSRADVENKLRYLVRLLQDDFTSPRLVGAYPDGTTYETEVHYSGGADHQWGSADTDGRSYCRWNLQVTSADPYFTSRASRQFSVTAAAGRGLLHGSGSLSKLQLSSSQALGQIVVQNDGDVSAWPTWRLEGPGNGFVAVRTQDGQTLNYAPRIDEGTVITISSRDKTITDQLGNNLYGGLVGAPKFFPVVAGRSSIGVSMIGSTAASRVTLSFNERRELIF